MNFVKIEENEKDTFTGKDLWSPFPNYPVFGGQLAAQSLRAGMWNVSETAHVVNLHTNFINPGSVNLPITYKVEEVKKGKTLLMKNITGVQAGSIIVQSTMTCSEPDYDMNNVCAVVQLRCDDYIPLDCYIKSRLSEVFPDEGVRDKHFKVFNSNLQLLKESFNIEVGEFKDNKRQIRIEILVARADQELNINDITLLITMISDLLIAESALLSMNLNYFSKELHRLSSIDHNLYFVTNFIPRRIFYYVVECMGVNECKASIEGKMCDDDGRPICIVYQQALVRLRNK